MLSPDGAKARLAGLPEDAGSNRRTPSLARDDVSHADVVRALHEYDRLGAKGFFTEHGFAPTATIAVESETRRGRMT
jgi:hypothetical protein